MLLKDDVAVTAADDSDGICNYNDDYDNVLFILHLKQFSS